MGRTQAKRSVRSRDLSRSKYRVRRYDKSKRRGNISRKKRRIRKTVKKYKRINRTVKKDKRRKKTKRIILRGGSRKSQISFARRRKDIDFSEDDKEVSGLKDDEKVLLMKKNDRFLQDKGSRYTKTMIKEILEKPHKMLYKKRKNRKTELDQMPDHMILLTIAAGLRPPSWRSHSVGESHKRWFTVLVQSPPDPADPDHPSYVSWGTKKATFDEDRVLHGGYERSRKGPFQIMKVEKDFSNIDAKDEDADQIEKAFAILERDHLKNVAKENGSMKTWPAPGDVLITFDASSDWSGRHTGIGPHSIRVRPDTMSQYSAWLQLGRIIREEEVPEEGADVEEPPSRYAAHEDPLGELRRGRDRTIITPPQPPPRGLYVSIMREGEGDNEVAGVTLSQAQQAVEEGTLPAAMGRSAASDAMESSVVPEKAPPPEDKLIGIMRHSARVDNPDDLAKADPTDPRLKWDDEEERPYDTPICDFDLPRDQAAKLHEFGFTRVVSSPFRRCLQTAGIVAQELGITTVDVHLGIGEAMAQVKRNGWPDDPEHELTYLTKEGMEAAVKKAPGATGSGLRLGTVHGNKPKFGDDDVQRIRDVLGKMCNELTSSDDAGGKVLLVTHGDVLAQWVDMAKRETVLQCDYCGFVVYGLESGDEAVPRDEAKPDNFDARLEDGVMSWAI